MNLIAENHEYELWVDNVRFGNLPSYDEYVVEQVRRLYVRIRVRCTCCTLSLAPVYVYQTGLAQLVNVCGSLRLAL